MSYTNRPQGIFSINKFLPPQGCPSLFPGPEPTPPPPKFRKKLVTDEICGLIKQNGNGEFVEYWRFLHPKPLPSGSVTILNTSDCIMTVRADTNGDGVADTILFTLTERDQTKSVTIGAIANLEISCEGGTDPKCSGRFCIKIEYEKHW
ncbi:S-Ena type endospore appendage [Peribacillus frigoritolerans]|uniref:S-Ena type endospore appendage n=1 Tax=Peribacillus frigoritolerans TaxID=450367 RepID=UPI0020BD5F5C|nr:S-Ena type endospore appendage [Peribacillus frigoritolerans]MEE3951674.1 S-Ena type endospore appendage [Peribacillus frigoritolerans]